MTWIKRIWMDGDTMRVDEISPEDFYRQPKEASMTDKIDTSTLGRIALASGKSPAPIEECVSTWAVDDGRRTAGESLRQATPEERARAMELQMETARINREIMELERGGADRIQSLIADNERLRKALEYAQSLLRIKGITADTIDAALSHKDMSK